MIIKKLPRTTMTVVGLCVALGTYINVACSAINPDDLVGNVYGTVIDTETGEGLPEVEIFLTETPLQAPNENKTSSFIISNKGYFALPDFSTIELTAITDLQGKFLINNVPTPFPRKEYTIIAKAPGFDMEIIDRLRVFPGAAMSLKVEFTLTRDTGKATVYYNTDKDLPISIGQKEIVTTPVKRDLMPVPNQALSMAQGTYRIYATREGLVGHTTANGHVIQPRDHFVALPSIKALSSKDGHEFEVMLFYKEKSVTAPVWDVGPWNIHDDYWNPESSREIYGALQQYWQTHDSPKTPLPPAWDPATFPVPPPIAPIGQGIPLAQKAYETSAIYTSESYNYGCDEYGRHRWYTPNPLNPAGIDLADGTFWDDLDMGNNDWISIMYLWTLYLDILEPKQSDTANAGLKDNPDQMLIEVQTNIPRLTENDFIVQIGGRTADILIVTPRDDSYVLNVQPPFQDANGLYDLTVSVVKENVVLTSDTEIEAISYSEGTNVDVPLVIDRSGSMSGGKIIAAKDAAKQFVDIVNEGDQVGVVSFSSDARVDFPLTLITPTSPGTVIFSDDMESGTTNWTADLSWEQITSDYHSPITSWTDSPGGNYPDYTDTSLTSIPIDIPTNGNARLSFWHYYEIESGYDYGKVEVSTDGGSTWSTLTSYTGSQYSWSQTSVDLSSYTGQIVRIRFRLVTDYSVTRDGWYIDDVEIRTGTFGDVKEQAKSAIDSLYASGSTSIGDGLQTGQNELNNRGDTTHAWAILLLSDGLENTPAYVADVLPGIPGKTDVYTIALGTDVDEALMQDIAIQTGGQYYFSPSSDQLQEIYSSIGGQITGEQTITSKSGIVNEGETKIETVIIDSLVSLARFLVNWPGSDIDLTLTDPSGSIIDPNVASTDPNISFVSASTYEYYTMDSPNSGEWRMNIEGVDTPWGGENYTARVTGKSDLILSTYFGKDRYETDQPITILASLSDASESITGASIEVVVQAPSQTFSAWKSVNGDTIPTKPLREPVSTLKSLYKESLNIRLPSQQSSSSPVFYLYDDGTHGDGQINDGVYGNLYTSTSNSGSYIFNFEASGTTNTGDSFTRITQRSLFVAQATATGSISGTISYTGSQTGTIYIEAWQDDPTMYGNPDYLTSISSSASYTLSNLPDGIYYLASYMDSNENRIWDRDEPRGIYGLPHIANSVIVSGGSQTSNIDISLIEGVISYPNPCYLNRGQVVKIANLTLNSKVYIYTISGELVRVLDDASEITTGGSSATAFWDGKNDAGEEVARGIYIYLATDNAGTKKTGKTAIIK